MARTGRKPSLTDQQVMDIRASKEKGDVLAAIYGVGHQTISKIRMGKLYGRVPGEVWPGRQRQLTEAQVREARRLHAEEGASQRGIGKMMGVSQGLIRAVVNGTIYKDIK